MLRIALLAALACALFVIAGCTLLPTALHALNPHSVYRVSDAGKKLFITIDDGPSAATPSILAVLRKHGVRATFFIISDHVDAGKMQEIVADGHQVAHHMKRSTSLDRLTDQDFQAEFLAADRALAPFRAVRTFRPPGGSISQQRAIFVRDQGYTIVVGTVYPLDHWLENPYWISKLAGLLATDGGIVILHDTRTRGPRTAAVLDQLIPEFRKRGYEFALLPTQFDQ